MIRATKIEPAKPAGKLYVSTSGEGGRNRDGLSCEDVSTWIRKPVVEHLNFRLEQEIISASLEKQFPEKVSLIKRSGTKKSMQECCRGEDLSLNVGYLPQQTVTQRDFPASVQEIVLSGFLSKRGMRPFYNKEERKIAQKNMKTAGIEPFAKKCYRDLSGGQQQRVLLARALCATSKLLLLDEPVAGLDPRVTAEMYELIQKLNREGITIIMVSHDTQAAAQYANKVLHVMINQSFSIPRKRI